MLGCGVSGGLNSTKIQIPTTTVGCLRILVGFRIALPSPTSEPIETSVESRSVADPEQDQRSPVDHVEEAIAVVHEMDGLGFDGRQSAQSLDTEPSTGGSGPSP